MLTLAAGYTSHAAGETTNFCTLWRVTRSDSTVFLFTDHDRDLVYSDGTYLASSGGYTASQVRNAAGLNVDDVEIAAVFDSSAVTEDDLAAGLWDGATVEIYSAVWSDTSIAPRPIRHGKLGQVTHDGTTYRAELRGLMASLVANVGRVISPACDALLGDARCGIGLSSFTHSFTVTSSSSRSQFTDSALAQDAGYFDYGVVTWETGANAGRSCEVKQHQTGGDVTLFLPMRDSIAVGDTGTIIAGCDKAFTTCQTKFSNDQNFRGFPHVPGTDRLISPRTSS